MSLKFVIPSGSLSAKLRGYLEIAGYPVREPDRTGFCGKVGDVAFFQLDRRMVPHFINTGKFDAGITGYDLFLASRAKELREVAELNFSPFYKSTHSMGLGLQKKFRRGTVRKSTGPYRLRASRVGQSIIAKQRIAVQVQSCGN